MLVTNAPAKINWTLEVLGRRTDGYHDVATVMSTVALSDTLTLAPAGEWRVTVEAPPALKAELEQDGGNLVHRAITLLCAAARECGIENPAAARLHLVKRVPAAAGLGGGSSDAAAALRLVCAYWRWTDPAAWRAIRTRLPDVAARLGSDVPFFLKGGFQLATGRGEQLQRLSGPAARRHIVILSPDITIERKTARLYAALTPADYSDGSLSAALAQQLRGSGWPAVPAGAVANAFERPAGEVFPELARYRQALAAATGAHPRLCGAGPALFTAVGTPRAARMAAGRLISEGYAAIVTSTVGSRVATAVRRTSSGL